LGCGEAFLVEDLDGCVVEACSFAGGFGWEQPCQKAFKLELVDHVRVVFEFVFGFFVGVVDVVPRGGGRPPVARAPPDAGSQTSIPILESATGATVATTRQNAGNFGSCSRLSGAVNAPAATDCATVMRAAEVLCFERLSQEAARSETGASAIATMNVRRIRNIDFSRIRIDRRVCAPANHSNRRAGDLYLAASKCHESVTSPVQLLTQRSSLDPADVPGAVSDVV